MKDGSPVIEVHIRISRRFVFWFVVVIVGLSVLWLLLTALSSGSGGLEIGPIQNEPQP